MQLLPTLVFFASFAGFLCADEKSFTCYQKCARSTASSMLGFVGLSSSVNFISICKRVELHSSSCHVFPFGSPLPCYQKCSNGNLTSVLDQSAGILKEYCAKDAGSLKALKANVDAFCTHWNGYVRRNNCSKLEGCEKATCTFDKTVNDIAYAYSEDSVKYATSYVKFLLGTGLAELRDPPLDKGCDVIYRTVNAAVGLQATGLVLTLASITSLIHALLS